MTDTAVNSQITDAVTQANVKVLGDAPAMAMGSLYQTIGNSIAMAAANAVYAQQQANITYQAATTLGVTKLFSSSNVASTADATQMVPNVITQEEIEAQIKVLTAQLEQIKAIQPGS